MLASAEATVRTDRPGADEPAGCFVVLTGGSTGIGRALCDTLADRGACVLHGSRSAGDSGAEHATLDLASLRSVEAFSSALLERGRPIDLLVLNAGVHVPWRTLRTEDGHELHWQVNHLANVLLVHRLLPLLRASRLKRIVYVASEAHRLAGLPLVRRFGFWRHYARSKEAAVSFFLHLGELEPWLDVRIVSPGYVETGVHRHKNRLEAGLERARTKPRCTADAAREIAAMALSPRGSVGRYVDRGVPRPPGRRTLDPEFGVRVWRRSLRELGEALPAVEAPRRVTNFAGTWGGLTRGVLTPASLEDLRGAVVRAADEGRRIRMVGSRHSYNDVFHSPECMISLERMDRIVGFDPARGIVTVQGGTPIQALCAFLDSRGFALRWSGNHGTQQIAGALATGTHGYARDGGLMSELVTAMTVVTADGTVEHVTDEPTLRALRLGLGTLGAVAQVSLAVEPARLCRYSVACLPREELIGRLPELFRAHQYLRFVTHPFDGRFMLYVTIDPAPDHAVADEAHFIGSGREPGWRRLVPLLRQPAVRWPLGRILRVGRHRYGLTVPFSTSLFVQGGIVPAHPGLAGAGRLALDRPDWLNMELAIPLEHFGEFERLFRALRPNVPRLSKAQPYYTCRTVGGSTRAWLGPNYGRDVVFVDLHANQRRADSAPFLRRLESEAIDRFGARPHWAKIFFSEGDRVRRLYPAGNVAAFSDAKRRFDPDGVFSNRYTERVLGS